MTERLKKKKKGINLFDAHHSLKEVHSWITLILEM